MENFDFRFGWRAYSSTDLAKLQIFEKILWGNVEGIIITDTHGNIEWVNNTFSLLTGHSKAEAQGKQLGFLFSCAQKKY